MSALLNWLHVLCFGVGAMSYSLRFVGLVHSRLWAYSPIAVGLLVLTIMFLREVALRGWRARPQPTAVVQ